MRLDLFYDKRLKVEDSQIMLPNLTMASRELSEGSELLLTGKNGKQVKLQIKRSPNEKSYVSRKTMYTLYKQEWKEVTLGCDPEFIILDKNGNTVKSADALGNTGDNRIGSDVSLAELRPDPGNTVDEVIENLRNLIRKVPFLLEKQCGKGHSLVPKSYSEINNKASGFHIHVGSDPRLSKKAMPGVKTFLDSYATALDYLVAIPASILEESHLRRTGTGRYGKAGDIRTNSRYSTIEYRACGGFHLRHPDYAAGILSLAKLAAENILNFIDGESCGLAYLPGVAEYNVLKDRFNLAEKEDIHAIYYSKDNKHAIHMLEGIINVVCNMKGYDKYQNHIEKFIELSVSQTRYSPNLLENW